MKVVNKALGSQTNSILLSSCILL